jgi:hypothetical protein
MRPEYFTTQIPTEQSGSVDDEILGPDLGPTVFCPDKFWIFLYRKLGTGNGGGRPMPLDFFRQDLYVFSIA